MIFIGGWDNIPYLPLCLWQWGSSPQHAEKHAFWITESAIRQLLKLHSCSNEQRYSFNDIEATAIQSGCEVTELHHNRL